MSRHDEPDLPPWPGPKVLPEKQTVRPRVKGLCRNCGRAATIHSLYELRVCAIALKDVNERERLEREVCGE